MTLPDHLKLEAGTPIILGNSAAHAPGATAANNLGAITDEISMASVADGAARQSDQFDFTLERPPLHSISAALEIGETPTAGKTIEFWLAYSPHATPGQAAPGNTTGVDSAWSGYGANVDEAKHHFERIGVFICSSDATGTVQVSMAFGFFVPKMRYASLIMVNKSGAAMHSDNIEMSVLLNPVEHKAID
jgi:hypothetical protein